MNSYVCGFSHYQGNNQLGWNTTQTDYTNTNCYHTLNVSIVSEDLLALTGLVGDSITDCHVKLPLGVHVDNINCVTLFKQYSIYIGHRLEVWQYNIVTRQWIKIADVGEVLGWTPAQDKMSADQTRRPKKLKTEMRQINKILCLRKEQDVRWLYLLIEGDVVQVLMKGDKSEKCKIIYRGDTEAVVNVCCGYEHVVMLTESGCVLTFSGGSRGQLGHGNLTSLDKPVQVSELEGVNVIEISCGGWHTCAVTDDGDVYVWGWNNYGQLGLNCQHVKVSPIPSIIDVDSKVVSASCGASHTALLASDGRLWTSGWNMYGQLGISNVEKEMSDKFLQIQVFKNLEQIFKTVKCGPWSTIVIS